MEAPHDNYFPKTEIGPVDVLHGIKKDGSEDRRKTIHKHSTVVGKLISSTPTHDIYREQHKDYHDIYFYAVNKKTRKSEMAVDGVYKGAKKNKIFHVGTLDGSKGSTIKAHHFYHHLMHAGHINQIVSDSSHSPGAKKVWHRLSKLPGVKMYHIDADDTVKPVKNPLQHYSNKPSDKRWGRRFIATLDK